MKWNASLFPPFLLALATSASPQEPAAWGPAGSDVVFHTFSIAAIDPETGEVGVAVTTRNACVGNGVPWVRVGVGAVATQASTRTEYGQELLDALEQGHSAEEALRQALAADDRAAARQVGVIGLSGGSAQHTGGETQPWSGHRAGAHYVTQGNLLEGQDTLEAVARAFAFSEGSGRHLADRLIEALEAGYRAGGDARKGRIQSAAVIVADPREGHSRRPDKVSTHINVCESPSPVEELRRVYDTVSETLGYRNLRQFAGRDVAQLEIMLRELGYLGGEAARPGDDDARALYGPELVAAVEAFRAAEGLSTSGSGSPPGFVDRDTVALLWKRLEDAGKARAVREQFLELTAVTR